MKKLIIMLVLATCTISTAAFALTPYLKITNKLPGKVTVVYYDTNKKIVINKNKVKRIYIPNNKSQTTLLRISYNDSGTMFSIHYNQPTKIGYERSNVFNIYYKSNEGNQGHVTLTSINS